MSTIVFDIEVAFYPEITKFVQEHGLDEKRFSEWIEAGMRYVTHISYKIDKRPVVDLSLLDYRGGIYGDANEKWLLQDFADAYNSCDESVAHYGSKFDIKFLNSRMARYKMKRLKPMKLIDTWRLMKDNFLLQSNKLETAIEYFKCPYGKPSLGWDIWRKVSLGDVAAHKILRHRCRYDTLSLAWIYYNVLRPFANQRHTHSLAVGKQFIDEKKVSEQVRLAKCPTCEAKALVREGYDHLKSSHKVKLSCNNCRSWTSAKIKADGSLERI